MAVKRLEVQGDISTARRDTLASDAIPIIRNSDLNALQAWLAGRWATLSWTTIGSYDPGTITVQTGQYLLQVSRLVLSGTETLRLEGTAKCIVFDLPSTSGKLVLSGRGGS
jgi:hypothetical protein